MPPGPGPSTPRTSVPNEAPCPNLAGPRAVDLAEPRLRPPTNACGPAKRLPTNPQSVLIVRFDLMGDVVNALSAAVAARATLAARPPGIHGAAGLAADCVRRCPAVDEVIPFDGGAVTHWPAVLDPTAWARALRILAISPGPRIRRGRERLRPNRRRRGGAQRRALARRLSRRSARL